MSKMKLTQITVLTLVSFITVCRGEDELQQDLHDLSTRGGNLLPGAIPPTPAIPKSVLKPAGTLIRPPVPTVPLPPLAKAMSLPSPTKASIPLKPKKAPRVKLNFKPTKAIAKSAASRGLPFDPLIDFPPTVDLSPAPPVIPALIVDLLKQVRPQLILSILRQLIPEPFDLEISPKRGLAPFFQLLKLINRVNVSVNAPLKLDVPAGPPPVGH